MPIDSMRAIRDTIEGFVLIPADIEMISAGIFLFQIRQKLVPKRCPFKVNTGEKIVRNCKML
jgi:hypothetical protein